MSTGVYTQLLDLACGVFLLAAVLVLWRRELSAIVRVLALPGVALAAIQGLLSQLQDLREENDRLAARVARLETATWSSLLVRGRSSLGQYRN